VKGTPVFTMGFSLSSVRPSERSTEIRTTERSKAPGDSTPAGVAGVGLIVGGVCSRAGVAGVGLIVGGVCSRAGVAGVGLIVGGVRSRAWMDITLFIINSDITNKGPAIKEMLPLFIQHPS